ncbi:hypothetical protein B0H13DRAFT_2272106 [Mycena leptocephala]|nr:hypothetical protein B0H13DRAFT_2272106 [Mycena leptocephala]
MLFKPFRKMQVEEWNSIPKTTNAAESQHYKIFSAIGKKHPLIPGLKGLRQLSHHYHLLSNAASVGIPIRYGKAEDWKHGLDTAKELAGQRGTKRRNAANKAPKKPPPPSLAARRPSYIWDRNSCWLDTSLELIFQTVSRGFDQHFGSRADTVHDAESVKKVFELMSLRKSIEDDPSSGVGPTAMAKLSAQRDNFRKFLKNSRMFLIPMLLIRYFCPGDDQTRNHLNLKRLTAATSFNLTADMSESYQGDTAAWFRSMVRINREPEDSPSCWRNIDDDGAKTCSGAATVLKLILGIPVILIFELPADWDG